MSNEQMEVNNESDEQNNEVVIAESCDKVDDVPIVEVSNNTEEVITEDNPDEVITEDNPEEEDDEVEVELTEADFEQIIEESQKNILKGNVTVAVEQMGMLCSQMSEKFGEQDYKMAKPSFVYGSALLELARMEADVLGNALEGIKENEADDNIELDNDQSIENIVDMNIISEKVIDAMCGEESPVKNETIEKIAVTDESADITEKAAENVNDASEVKDKDNEEVEQTEEKEDEEDPSNLQVAWENIDLARILYGKSCENISKEKEVDGESHYAELLCLSDCYEKLADINVEQSNFEDAKIDYLECLKLREQIYEMPTEDILRKISNGRLLSESFFKISVPLKLIDVAESVPYIKSSISTLNNTLDLMKIQLENKSNLEEDLLNKIMMNNDEIKKLIPDLEDNLQDIQDEVKAVTEATKEMKQSVRDVMVDGGVITNNEEMLNVEPIAVASDITHLVRKKASPLKQINGDSKIEFEHVSACEPPIKKSKVLNEEVDNIVNGEDMIVSAE